PPPAPPVSCRGGFTPPSSLRPPGPLLRPSPRRSRCGNLRPARSCLRSDSLLPLSPPRRLPRHRARPGSRRLSSLRNLHRRSARLPRRPAQPRSSTRPQRTPLRLPQSPIPLLPRMHHPVRRGQPPRPQVARAFSLRDSRKATPPRRSKRFGGLQAGLVLSSVLLATRHSSLATIFNTCSYSAPFVANPSPPEIVRRPRQSVNLPPASSRMGISAAASHSCSAGSSMISARPVATSMYP